MIRCTALSTDLDGNICGRRMHELTDELLEEFTANQVWVEYGINTDITVHETILVFT